jgi:hypothetical protein
MRRVSIQKVAQDEAGAFLGLGNPHKGLELTRPTVGREYVLFHDSGRLLKTSDVLKVKDGFFETRNSYYKVTVLEEEPFDLTGGDGTQKTGEIQIPASLSAET